MSDKDALLALAKEIIDVSFENTEDNFFTFSSALTELKNKAKNLPDDLKELVFVQYILNGDNDAAEDVIKSAADCLYTNLVMF